MVAFQSVLYCAVPGEAGAGSECLLFGAQPDAAQCGAVYELSTGALTLSNITACDAAEVQAVADAAVPLAGAGLQAQVGQGTTATKVLDTAAAGMSVHSDLSFVTEEECVVACSVYILGCTHVTSGVCHSLSGSVYKESPYVCLDKRCVGRQACAGNLQQH